MRNAEQENHERPPGVSPTVDLSLMSEVVSFTNLIEVFQWHLERHGDRLIFRFLADGEREAGQLDYATLDRKSRAIAAEMQRRGAQGTRALLMFQNGLDLVTAFYACLRVGVCAVPVYPPRNRPSYVRRLEGIAADCDAKLILGTSSYLDKVGDKLDSCETLARATRFAVDELDGAAPHFTAPSVAGRDTAFLQYTSGSTSAPKGVVVSHYNLLHNIAAMQRRFELDQDDVIVSWLPLFHDMGLIGAVLQTILLGATCIVMTPAAFLQEPKRWLRAISKYRGTTTFAPDFAYELCARKIPRADLEALDLSSWTMALDGAEPIKPSTVERFKAACAATGMPEHAVYPGYGLAEATLYVSGSERLSPIRHLDVDVDAYERRRRVRPATEGGKVRRLVSSGTCNPDLDVVIVDPERRVRCPEGTVGEIWVHGGSVTQGYWGRPQETEDRFRARIHDEPGKSYLRTGDLGFLWEGHLFVSGRINDVLVIRGANYFPQDVEALVQEHVAGLKAGGGAAFTVEVDGENQLVLVHEVERTWQRRIDPAATFRQAARLVSEELGLSLRRLCLIRPSTLPKTSSGKVQRAKARARYLDDELALVAVESGGRELGGGPAGAVAGNDGECREISELVDVVSLVLSRRTGLPLKEIDPHQAVAGFGLDSLALAELAESIATMCGVRVPLGRLLEARALVDVARLILELRDGADDASSVTPGDAPPPPRTADDKAFPLSLNQTQMLLSFQRSPDSAACNVPFCIEGSFDTDRLRGALRDVVEAHPILAARFEFDAAAQEWQQTIGGLPDELLVETDVSHLDEAQVGERLVDATRAPFDLDRGLPFRFEILAGRSGRQWLLLVFHHICVDLVSIQKFVGELLRRYAGAGPVTGESERKPYRDFVQWQRAFVESGAGRVAARYWRERLQGERTALQWPASCGRAAPGAAGGSVEFSSAALTTERLQARARHFGVTVNALLLAAYRLFLAKLCGQRSFNIGITHVGRPGGEFRDTLGYFAEPVVFVADMPVYEVLDDLVKGTQRQLVDIIDHAGAALHVLLEGDERAAAETNAYQTLFTYYPHRPDVVAPFNAGMVPAPLPGAPGLSYVPLPAPGSQLDLSLLAADDGRCLQFRFEFDGGLFDRQRVTTYAGYYIHVLEALLDAAGATTGDVSLIPAETEAEVRALLGGATVDFGETRPVHVLIEENARRHPERPAVRFEGESLTYAELFGRADALASEIVDRVPPGANVGVFAERSFDMVTALLAVLKAGCAYVPIDPQAPPDRIERIVESAGVPLILLDGGRESRERFAVFNESRPGSAQVIDVARVTSRAYDGPAVLREVRGDDLAYVIFTSGSTGEPKGVMNSHGALLNRLLWMKSACAVDLSDRILQKTPFTFDVSVWEFFLPLLSSATLVLAKPGGHRDSGYLTDLIDREGVTLLHFVPSMLDAFLADSGSRLGRVKRVVCSGEELPAELQRRFFSRFPQCELHNLYGPTEAAIDVSAWRCIVGDDAPRVPIGAAISNIGLYVLDAELQPVPAGVTGELYIAGKGLARGYVGRPDLTAEKFLPDPFAAERGGRMYQTGDLVRFDPDGAICYLGRTDSQVKIRGFRIELGEIDSRLLELPGVREAATVVTGEGGDRKLSSYLVFHADAEPPAADEIKAALGSRLPDYMVPSYVTTLDTMPLNANGKLDRKALPAPEIPDDAASEAPPDGEREQALADVWARVLGVDVRKISRHHDFFALGGHSLSAAKLSATCRSRLGAELSLRDIFAAPTLAAQAGILRFTDARQDAIPVGRHDSNVSPLSSTQSRIWFLSKFRQQGAAYNVPVALAIAGALDCEALIKCVADTVMSHDILRTRYGSDGNEPFQIADPVAELVVERCNLKSCDRRSAARQRDRMIEEHAEAPFNLSEQWPVRAMLIEQPDDQATLLLCFHHIAVDGISVGLLLEEIGRRYRRRHASGTADGARTRLQYRDFARWQRDRMRGERRERLLRFWTDRLADLPPLLPLPADRVRPPRQTVNGACLDVTIDHRLAAKLKRIARRADASLFMVLVSVYKLLLSIYAGTRDVAVGTPVTGRTNPELDDVVGFFANTVVLRTAVDRQATFGDLVRQVKDTTLSAYEHQEIPFQHLVEALRPDRSLSYSPVFQVLFSLERPHDLAGLFGGAREPAAPLVTQRKRPHGSAKFDLALMLEEAGSGVEGYFEFNTDIFETATIERMRAHFLRMLEEIGAASRPADLRLVDIEYLGEDEKHELLVTCNDAPETVLADSIAEVFAACAGRCAERAAVVCGAERLSYRELDARSSALAGRLQRAGVAPGQAVGLYLRPGIEPIVGMLATVKCGACYVPLDAGLPEATLARILEVAEPACILTGNDMPVIGTCPSVYPGQAGDDDGSFGPPAYDPRDLAYVMFTSGSTGTPKGVKIRQRGVLRLVTDPNFVELDERTVLLQAASLAFDAATFEIWGALLNGGLLVVNEDRVLTADSLAGLVRRHGINTAWLTASLFSSLIDENPDCTKGLRYLLVGGDIVSPEHVARVYERCADVQIINGYGPTECTTFAACHRIDRDSVATPRGTVAIGRPINNTELHVLDAERRLVPVGVVGELYIGGDGLADGYLGTPEPADEKFIEWRPTPGNAERLYRSGDLVRRLPDGVLEFMGRADGQVKIRGFRVDLAAVNAAVSRAPGVRNSATIAATVGDDRKIVSYVTGDDVDPASVRSHLMAQLPSYMVPAFVVSLDALPLTRNGKLDVEALPDYRAGIAADAADRPETPCERLLQEIWADLLGLSRDQLSRHSHFFELGGHSLLAARMVADVNARQAADICIRDVFESPVLSRLAARLGGIVDREPTISRIAYDGLHRLSHAQSRMWFLSTLDSGEGVYNVPLTLKLTGRDGPIDDDLLIDSLRDVVRRHDILRTRYRNVDGVPMQWVEPDDGKLQVDRIAVGDDDDDEVASFAAAYHGRRFDLDTDLPIRACVISGPQDVRWLLVCVHHIATDGWSMDLLTAELAAFYNNRMRPDDHRPLPTLQIQYLDFTYWQERWLRGERERRQADYWKKRLSGLPPKLALPTDHPRPSNQSFSGRCHKCELPQELAASLTEVCLREGCTLYMLMLAGLKILMAKYSGDDDIAIGSPVANRPVAELQHLIGFFANTIVLRTRIDSGSTVQDLMWDVRENTLGAYDNQDLPFERLVDLLQPERSLSYSPLFQVMFSLQQAAETSPEFAGLGVQRVRHEHTQSKFDLSFMLEQDGSAIGGYIEYSTALYEQATVERMWRHYVHVLEQMAEDLTVRVGEVRLERCESVARLYDGINAASVEVPPLALSRIVEQRAESTPDRIAVRDAGKHLTYRRLNSLANGLARRLIAEGVGDRSACAVFLPRRMELVVALLAIHKSGGFYVPIDPNYPAGRVADILESAEPRIVLTSSDLSTASSLDGVQSVLVVDELLSGAGFDRLEPNLDRDISLDQPAYAIYTSGSTGKPKGIAITHRNAAAMLAWARAVYSPAELADVLAATSICFDLSVYELFLPLSAGGCIHLVEDFLSLLEPPAPDVSLVNTVPSAMEALLQAGSLPVSIRTVNLAGEPLSRALADNLYRLPHIEKVYNLYGPSEDTTYSTYALVPRESAQQPTIGRPIANTRAYVLDEELNRLPVGVAGELCLAGDGVSLGYIGRPGLTSERYLPDPFASLPGTRMYRTGDRVRLRADGELDYLGRDDDQVKVRGFRIELGEIESVLERQDDVEDVAVVVNGTSGTQPAIVAFVKVAPPAAGGDRRPHLVERLRRSLADTLPDYMQPAHWQLVTELPLLPNGKVDRKGLSVRPVELERSDGMEAPETATELALAEIWSELLGVGRFCRRQNFFSLGGHSLLATQLLSRVQGAFAVVLTIRDVFQHPTLAEQARLVDLLSASAGPAVTPHRGSRRHLQEEGAI